MRLALVTLAAVCMTAACSSGGVDESDGAVAQAADGAAMYLTTRDGRITGAASGNHRIRVDYETERLPVRANDDAATVVEREWTVQRTTFEEAGKAVYATILAFEPVSKLIALRGFDGLRERTCLIDFSHARATGYGQIARDDRAGGRSVAFATGKWALDAATPGVTCNLAELLPLAEPVMRFWSPVFRYMQEHTDAGSGTVRPQDWFDATFEKLNPDSRFTLEAAVVAGLASGAAGALGGALTGGPLGAGIGFVGGFSGTFGAACLTGYFLEQKRKNDERRKANENGRGPTADRGGARDEPGTYREPRPSDVGWDGEADTLDHGGDGSGLGAGDIPPTDGRGGYPGGSGPYGGPGGPGGCTDGDDGRLGIGSFAVRPMMWCP